MKESIFYNFVPVKRIIQNDTYKNNWWFIFYQISCTYWKRKTTLSPSFRRSAPIAIPEEQPYTLTTPDGISGKSFYIDSLIPETPEYVQMGLRASYDYLPIRQHYQAAGKAHEILYWDCSNRFAPHVELHWYRKRAYYEKCPDCGKEVYPAISTAILVLVRKEDSLLLVHARNFKGTFNSIAWWPASFETGETLEECVEREVKEETGLDVNIQYFGNQPWPYPSGLHGDFIADYAGAAFACRMTNSVPGISIQK